MCSPAMNIFGQRASTSPSGAHAATPRQASTAYDIGRTGANAAGFARVERLAGNVGYLELVRFAPVDEAHRPAAAVMEMLTGSDALVIDLRRNGGGDPRTAALVTSYLFDTAPLDRDEVYEPSTRVSADPETQPLGAFRAPVASRPMRTPSDSEPASAPVRRYARQDLRLLVGPRTSALAREFARNLEGLRGATIVEEAA